MNSDSDFIVIQQSISNQDLVRVQSSSFSSSFLEMRAADSMLEHDFDLSSLSDLDSNEYTFDKFNSDSNYDESNFDQKDYHDDDEIELESDEQVNSTESLQVSAQV